MSIDGKSILITGATGGIGGAIARQLASRNVSITITGRRRAELEAMATDLRRSGASVHIWASDLSEAEAPQRLADDVLSSGRVVDILVNCAGIQTFGLFGGPKVEDLDRLFDINVIAPMALTRAFMPHMLERRRGQIVNVGSIFGSIGFPCFASYSATKFAIRGFSEALRRELDGTGVSVTYVAPRFTKTSMNGRGASRMADALRLKQDEPSDVAASVIEEIERKGKDRYLGWPEKLFVRLNSVLPRLVDGALIKQSRRMSPFATDL
jgi:short-subunit dehydrogenase